MLKRKTGVRALPNWRTTARTFFLKPPEEVLKEAMTSHGLSSTQWLFKKDPSLRDSVEDLAWPEHRWWPDGHALGTARLWRSKRSRADSDASHGAGPLLIIAHLPTIAVGNGWLMIIDDWWWFWCLVNLVASPEDIFSISDMTWRSISTTWCSTRPLRCKVPPQDRAVQAIRPGMLWKTSQPELKGRLMETAEKTWEDRPRSCRSEVTSGVSLHCRKGLMFCQFLSCHRLSTKKHVLHQAIEVTPVRCTKPLGQQLAGQNWSEKRRWRFFCQWSARMMRFTWLWIAAYFGC